MVFCRSQAASKGRCDLMCVYSPLKDSDKARNYFTLVARLAVFCELISETIFVPITLRS